MKKLLLLLLFIPCVAYSQVAMISGGVPSGAAPTNDLLTDLVSLWEVDEASGTIYDAHGSNDATSPGDIDGITYQLTSVTNLNYAIEFDGSDPYVRPDTVGFSIQPPFSISWWMKEAAASDYYLRLYSGSDGWMLRSSSGGIVELYVRATGGGTTSQSPTSNSDLTDDAWHNVVGICTPDSTYMYVDGVLQDDVAVGGLNTIIYTGTVFEWGTNAGANDYGGEMDQVAFWSKELDQDDIDDLYNSGDGLAYTNFESE